MVAFKWIIIAFTVTFLIQQYVVDAGEGDEKWSTDKDEEQDVQPMDWESGEIWSTDKYTEESDVESEDTESEEFSSTEEDEEDEVQPMDSESEEISSTEENEEDDVQPMDLGSDNWFSDEYEEPEFQTVDMCLKTEGYGDPNGRVNYNKAKSRNVSLDSLFTEVTRRYIYKLLATTDNKYITPEEFANNENNYKYLKISKDFNNN